MEKDKEWRIINRQLILGWILTLIGTGGATTYFLFHQFIIVAGYLLVLIFGLILHREVHKKIFG